MRRNKMNYSEMFEAIQSMCINNINITIKDKEVKLLKKSRVTKATTPYTVVTKSYSMNCVMGLDYCAEANKHKEPSEQIADDDRNSLPWGEWVDYPYFIKHKEAYYLRVFYPEVLPESVEYFADGKPVLFSDIADYVNKPSSSSETIVLTLPIASIHSITEKQQD
jgi:hypothetical protein